MTDLKSRARIFGLLSLEWLIKSFYIYLRNFGQRGLVASIILTSIPLALNFSCLIIFFFYLIVPGLFFKAGFLGTGGLAFISYAVIDHFLENEFVKRKRKIDEKYYLVFYLLSPIYFLGSVYLFIYFFRFL